MVKMKMKLPGLDKTARGRGIELALIFGLFSSSKLLFLSTSVIQRVIYKNRKLSLFRI